MDNKRIKELLEASLEYIAESVGCNDLYSTLHNCIGVSDEEMRELGIGYAIGKP